MKKFKFSVILLAVFFIAGCSTHGYRYVENGGNPYISLNGSYFKQASADGHDSSSVPAVYFSSIEEMKKDLKQGNFTEDELKQLAQFPANEKGDIAAPVLDTLLLSLPSIVEFSDISWTGFATYFRFELQNGFGGGAITEMSQKDIRKDLEERYFSFKERTDAKIEEVPEANGKIPGTAYYVPDNFGEPGESIKMLHYEVTTNDTTYYVQEHYEQTDSGERMYFFEIWAIGKEASFNAYLTPYDNDVPGLSKLTVDEITAFKLTI